MKFGVLMGASALLLTLATACDKEATGQVVAVVNGEEVSLSELNGELQNAGATQAADKQAASRAALQQLIDRKLLVQEAKERGLDKDPEFLRQQRRANDELLIAMLGKQVGSNMAVPTPAEVDKFVAENPTMFAQRAIYQFDQIQFNAPTDRNRLKELQPAKTMEQVVTILDGWGVQYQRRPATLDGATAPPALVQAMGRIPAGEPFILMNGPRVIISVIKGQQARPLSPEDSKALAAQSIRRRSLADSAQKQIKSERDAAKIEYQPGYEPPKDADKGKAAATPAAPAAK